MNFFSKRERHDAKKGETLACKECHEEKAVMWDCAWDASHLICSKCAASCSRCGKYYCDDCRVVLVFCDSCDAMFCPDCKPRVCVCIIPRMATCFMVNFKRRSAQDIAEEEKEPPAKRMKHQISDATTSTNQTNETTAAAAGLSTTNDDGDTNDIELVRPKTQFKDGLDG